MIGVERGLGRQVERNGKARLPLFQILAIERIRRRGRRMTRIGAEDPRRVGACWKSVVTIVPRSPLFPMQTPRRPAHRASAAPPLAKTVQAPTNHAALQAGARARRISIRKIAQHRNIRPARANSRQRIREAAVQTLKRDHDLVAGDKTAADP